MIELLCAIRHAVYYTVQKLKAKASGAGAPGPPMRDRLPDVPISTRSDP